MTYQVLAFYHFQSVDESRLPSLRTELTRLARAHAMHGLMILGTEGVNATLSGRPEQVDLFLQGLCQNLGVARIEGKRSSCERHPFKYFKCKIRPEIVTTHDATLDARAGQGTHLTPAEWQAKLSDKDVLVVDTRNWYETQIGKFRGAVDLNLKQFGDFAQYLPQLPKDKTVLIYCTGGIRCEKAVVEMKRQGFADVYQLEGGILNYLKEFPNGDFEGECFVFDYRVAVDQALRPSERFRLCPHCGQPGEVRVTCRQCQKPGIICAQCEAQVERQTCSKNCAHHLRMGHRCRTPYRTATA